MHIKYRANKRELRCWAKYSTQEMRGVLGWQFHPKENVKYCLSQDFLFSRMCHTRQDHITPILRKNLDKIVLHVGTNGLPSSTSARECAEEIVNLAHMISDESSAKLSTSSPLVSKSPA